MKIFIEISGYINKLINLFGEFFNDATMSREECQKFARQSTLLHQNLIANGDLAYYEKQIALAKATYKIMLKKINDQQIVTDIIFCGNSERPWEETQNIIYQIYGLNMHREVFKAFYHLEEISNYLYLDSRLPRRK